MTATGSVAAPGSRVERRSRRGLRARRVAALAAVGALLLAAAVAGERGAAEGSSGAAVAPGGGPVVPAGDSNPAAWYCAAGTGAPDGRLHETLVMSNLGSRPARVTVTVMPGGEARPVSEDLSIGGRSQRRLAIADVAASGDPGVVVEASGGPVIVDHRIAAGDHRAVAPCARDAGTEWYTTGGTTVEGASQWLVIFNPFPDDALVDVRLFTAEGVKERDDLSGLAVPARSKITVPVHEKVLDSARVGTVVRARAGRVVVEQALLAAAPYPRPGLMLSPGVERASERWYLPAGSGAEGDSETLTLLNPSGEAVPVTVKTVLDSGQFLEADRITVDGDSVALVDLRARTPAGVGFWVRVDAPRPVVVGSVLGRSAGEGGSGLAATPGVPSTARRWALAAGRMRDTSGDRLSVANPGRRAVRFGVRVVGGGRSRVLDGAERLTVAPGRRAVIDLAAASVPADAAVVVVATGPVVVQYGAGSAPGVLRQAAIPFAS